MPVLDRPAEVLPDAPGSAQWPVWSTTARVVVTEPAALPAARRLLAGQLEAVDAAASRFRSDSEVCRLAEAGGRSVPVSPLLAELVRAALDVAAWTDGDVDPTVGAALVALGYDRDVRELAGSGPDRRRAVRRSPTVVVRTAPGWRSMHLDGTSIRLPAGVLLDLGATAKAWAADRGAALIADRLDVGVLVSLGGDLATAGPAPEGGWRVLVQDAATDPTCTVLLPAGAALATSSTVRRRWRQGGRMMHHVVDPRTCRPAPEAWRTVSAAASRCLDANAITMAAVVRGTAALPWLRALGAPVRLVDRGGHVRTVGGWPVEQPAAATPRGTR